MVTLDNQVKDLQALFKQMGEDSEGAKDKDNYPIAIPNDESAREKIVDRLRVLFVEGIKRASGGYNDRHYPVPGQPDNKVSDGDLENLSALTGEILPDPQDPHFAEALRNRIAGVMQVLGHIVNIQNNGKDTGATLRSMMMAVRQVRKPGDQRLPLYKVDWEGNGGRKETLSSRARTLADIAETSRLRNVVLQLSAKFNKSQLGKEFAAVINAFNAGQRFIMKDQSDVIERNALMKKLLGFLGAINLDNKATVTQKLTSLTTDFMATNNAESFRNAVPNTENTSPPTPPAGETVH